MTLDYEEERLSDESLIALIEDMSAQSGGTFLNTSELQSEREKATYEYTGQAKGHLTPQGVSTIVDSSTTEAVDGYVAVISELLFDNNKIAKLRSTDSNNPMAVAMTRKAEDLVNYEIFVRNKGWKILNSWVKASMLWKNSIIRWDWVDDTSYTYEEYESVTATKLDELLANDNVELIGDLQYENESNGDMNNPDVELTYKDVRLRIKKSKSKVNIRNVPSENFSIDSNATSLEDFSFIEISEEGLTRTDLKQRYPLKFTKNFNEWEYLSNERLFNNADQNARKDAVGIVRSSDWDNGDLGETYTVFECWLHVDRDNDGIAELKRVVYSGSTIIFEEDVDCVDLACLSPIEIPYEFHGLSMADVTRSSTMTSTAILRGFVENVYLTNFSPRLADPNTVDFAALQNMKPKQIIPVNGNPQTAVAMLQPETISTGTVPLLQHMQTLKEQSNGLSKAAQGLNDTLYVSGNSEGKMAQVQSAAQKRIQYIARRMVETGIKDLVVGVYNTLRKNAIENRGFLDRNGVYASINPDTLPEDMDISVEANIGENSNQNMMMKLGQVAQIIGTLKESGRDLVINPVADARLAAKGILALDLDPADYLVDWTSEEFLQKSEERGNAAQAQQDKENAIAEIEAGYKAIAAEANARLISTQADNAKQDNAKQLAVAMDTHHQKWAEIYIKAKKDGITAPTMPVMEDLMKVAYDVIQQFGPGNQAKVDERLNSLTAKLDSIRNPKQEEGMQ